MKEIDVTATTLSPAEMGIDEFEGYPAAYSYPNAEMGENPVPYESGLDQTVPVEPTLEDVRKFRHDHVTETFQTLRCGHKESVGRVPKRNCDVCWVTFFQSHGDFSTALLSLLEQHGVQVARALHGDKLVKNFLLFLAAAKQLSDSQGPNV